MNRFWLITKVQLKNIFQQSNRKKNALHLGTYTFGILLMAFLGVYYAFMLFNDMDPSMFQSIPMLMAYVVTIIIFVMGISTSRGMLFGFKDLDMLRAMPFTDKEIVFSKLSVFTLTEYAYSGAFLIPVLILYGVKAGMGILFYVLSIIGFITMPLIPIVLASVIGMYLERLSAGKKHSDAIRNASAVIVFVIFYAFMMYTSMSSNSSTAGFIGMNKYFDQFLPVTKWYMQGSIDGNVLLVLATMVISVVVYALFILFYSKNVMKVNSMANQGYHEANFQMTRAKKNSAFKALLHKEIQRFIKNFMYVFNTAFGMILLVGGSVYLMFVHNDIVAFFTDAMSASTEISAFISQMLILGIVMLGQMTCTTACSISLEGKSMWITKTLPVSVTQIFWSKMLVNILLIMIPSTISLILLGITFQFQIPYFLLGFVFIVVSSLFISMLGLILNLAFPKLEFENEQEVIKQSMSSFIAVFLPMIICIVMVIWFISSAESSAVVFYVYLIGLVLADGVMYSILMSNGKKKFLSLN